MVPVLLLVGEIAPKTLAIRNNIAFASAQARPIQFFSGMITPLRRAVRLVSDQLLQQLKHSKPTKEVVEDIQDEYDTGEELNQWIRKLDKGEFIISARVPIDDLAEQLSIELP